jgi:hypothetical protein
LDLTVPVVIDDDLPASLEVARLLRARLGAESARFETFSERQVRGARAVVVCAEPEPAPDCRYPRGLFWLRWLRLHTAHTGPIVLVSSAPLGRLKRWGPEAAWLRDGSVRLVEPAAALEAGASLLDLAAAALPEPGPRERGRWKRWTPLDVAALAARPLHRLENAESYARILAGDDGLRVRDVPLNGLLEPWAQGHFDERFELMASLCRWDPAAELMGERVARLGAAHHELCLRAREVLEERECSASALRSLAKQLAWLVEALGDLRKEVRDNGCPR